MHMRFLLCVRMRVFVGVGMRYAVFIHMGMGMSMAVPVIVPVMMMIVAGCWRVSVHTVQKHARLGRLDAAAVDFPEFEGNAKRQGIRSHLEHCGIDTCVNEGAEKHVARDAGEALQIRNLHGVLIPPAAASSTSKGSTSFIAPER